ncbi:YfcL family protein [Oceanisphaera pacifica]|uniref:YfcL family protein n=1 Tax=Oceanisphaera pacifica TaxID=2818389 RepID=A0ABS3NFN4_9GAMM|nr:YfcL family protein [Oceanisphaera pacifica]MBO1519388.1 YfcL family protein [Oceanisphaera pacifica]
MDIFEFERRLLTDIDSNIASATDDQLFAGGYLRGHITLSVAQCEIEGRTHVRDVKARVNNSLNQAILNGELNSEDQTLVESFWTELVAKVEQTRA